MNNNNNRKRRLDQPDGPFFRCHICPYATHDSFDFYQHTITMHGSISNKYPWFGCPVEGCYYTVSDLTLFSDHRTYSHPETKDSVWGVTSRFNIQEAIYCPSCRCPPFTNAYLFYAHVKQYHDREYKWDFKFGCTKCPGTGYDSFMTLIAHFKKTPTCTGTCTLNWTRRVPVDNLSMFPNIGHFLRNNNVPAHAMADANDVNMD